MPLSHYNPPSLTVPNATQPKGDAYIIGPNGEGSGGGTLQKLPNGTWLYSPNPTFGAPSGPDEFGSGADDSAPELPDDDGADD